MTAKYTGADAILDTLKKLGINNIFGYPGGAVIPFYDRLSYHKDINHYLVRNEQGAAFAAQGFARTKKGIGVCVTTSGPGVGNIITAIADAQMDSIPMLIITGQVVSKMIGNDAFQELDSTGVTMNITKHNYLVTNVKDIVPVIAEALYIAGHGRPGPVHIDVSRDVFLADHDPNFEIPQISDFVKKKYTITPKTEHISNFFELLKNAQKPVLIVGQGVKHANAEELVNQFIQKIGIPTVTTLLAKGVVKDSPYYLGMLGMHGFYHANLAVHNADLIINIGSRFDDRIVGNYDTFGKNAKIVHVDIDKSEINKIVKVDLAINSDAGEFLTGVLSQDLEKLNVQTRLDQIDQRNTEHPYQQTTTYFSIKNVLESINKKLGSKLDNFIFVTDVGQHQMWSAQKLCFQNSGQWLTSGGSGTMGFSLPVAMGAAVSNPDKTIVCIVGDGSFQMNIQELMTIKDYGFNIKILVMNNNFLGMVRQWQDMFHQKNYSSTPITCPDIEKLAQAYGLKGIRVDNEALLESALNEIFIDNQPILAEFKVQNEENIYPMVPPGQPLNATLVG